MDPERSWVDAGSGSITSLIQSLNTPLVAAGPHPAENVQSWILTKGASGGAIEVFVYFHLTESNQAVLYRWDGGPVPGPSQEQVIEEAMGFCESMGFMMDNLNFGQLPPDKRGELLQTLPPFQKDLSLLVKEPEEIPLSMSKRVVDPVEEFARARAAMQESGQPTSSSFADPNDARSDQFDPMSLTDDIGTTSGPGFGVAPTRGNDEMQIEITEIDGLDLLPAPDAVPVSSRPARMQSSVVELDLNLDDEPPLVVGSANATPAPRPAAPMAAAPAPVPIPPPAEELPIARGRERTPAGEVTVFDDSQTASQPPPVAMAAAPTTTAPPAPAPAPAPAPSAISFDDDFNVDDLLADVDIAKPSTNGKTEPAPSPSSPSALDLDVSSALDDILDGVESSRSPKQPAAAPVAGAAAPTVVAPLKPVEKPNEKPSDEISLDLDMEGSIESSISSPDEALLALDALGVQDDPLSSLPTLEEPPPGSAAARPAVEAAWATEAPAPSKANGNGSHTNGGAAAAVPMRLDISTDDLARLLSML